MKKASELDLQDLRLLQFGARAGTERVVNNLYIQSVDRVYSVLVSQIHTLVHTLCSLSVQAMKNHK